MVLAYAQPTLRISHETLAFEADVDDKIYWRQINFDVGYKQFGYQRRNN